VKTHVSNILGKLHVDDRTQAAIYALKKGLDSRSPGIHAQTAPAWGCRVRFAHHGRLSHSGLRHHPRTGHVWRATATHCAGAVGRLACCWLFISSAVVVCHRSPPRGSVPERTVAAGHRVDPHPAALRLLSAALHSAQPVRGRTAGPALRLPVSNRNGFLHVLVQLRIAPQNPKTPCKY